MKAIIMAGGEGSRLRPLTCSVPKPLAPLCGKPVSVYILELLKKHGIVEAVFTLGYQSEKIIDYFKEEPVESVAISYSVEDEPLGTAGSVKKACGQPSDVMVISGDAMCDFDLTAAINYHKQKNADVTIIVKKVEDPREYGLVLASSEGKVKSFLEKPSYESCVTDLANTGVYILSKDVVESIPSGENLDFAQDIFPELLSNGKSIYAYQDDGYWCDIGDFKSYLKCQKDILNELVKCELNAHKTLDGIYNASPDDFVGAVLKAPAYIGKNVKIGKGAVIESGSIINDDVTISKGAKIHGSAILKGAYIGENVTCNEAVICENARLLHSSAVYEGGVAGANSVIGENSVIESGVKVWAGKSIESNINANYDVKYGHFKKLFIDDDGICGETNGEITPQIATALGSALGNIAEKVAIGYSSAKASKAMSYAISAGVASTGSDTWNAMECTEPELSFLMSQIDADIGCFVDAGVTCKLKLMDKDGLPLTRKQERNIENGINRSEYKKATFSYFGEITEINGIRSLYKERINKIIPQLLQGIKAEVTSSNTLISDMCNEILKEKSDDRGRRLIFHIGSDGKKISAYSDETGYMYYEKLILIGSNYYFTHNKDISLPYSAPKLADVLASDKNCEVLRYYNCSVDGSDKQAREMAKKCRIGRDAIELMAYILAFIAENKSSLMKEAEKIPQFTSVSRFVSLDKSPADVLKSLCEDKSTLGEGVVAEENEDRVLIRPVKTGKGVMMFVESYKAETASEICDFYQKKLFEQK